MKIEIKKEYGGLVGIIIIILFFVAGLFLANSFNEYIVEYLDLGIVGMFIYVFVGILATVVAPMSAVPLIPIVVVLWGPFLTAVLSIIGWTVGSVIAFIIARYFGKPLVSKFVNLESVSKYEKSLGERYLFWDIVLLRIAVPVDILSYAIGLFSSMKIGSYTLATIIGVIPFAFIIPYASQVSLIFQVFIGFLAILMMYFGYRKIKKL